MCMYELLHPCVIMTGVHIILDRSMVNRGRASRRYSTASASSFYTGVSEHIWVYVNGPINTYLSHVWHRWDHHGQSTRWGQHGQMIGQYITQLVWGHSALRIGWVRIVHILVLSYAFVSYTYTIYIMLNWPSTYILTYWQTHRQTNRQTNKQTDERAQSKADKIDIQVGMYIPQCQGAVVGIGHPHPLHAPCPH